MLLRVDACPYLLVCPLDVEFLYILPPSHTRYLDSRNYEGVRRKKYGSGSWIDE